MNVCTFVPKDGPTCDNLASFVVSLDGSGEGRGLAFCKRHLVARLLMGGSKHTYTVTVL